MSFDDDLMKLREIVGHCTSGAPLDDAVAILNRLHRMRPRGVRLSVCTLVREQGKVLCVTRKEDATKVCLPGGFVEPEDYSDGLELMLKRAAIRELLEETGLTAKTVFPTFAALDDVGTFCTMLCASGVVRGSLKPEPGTECLWLGIEEFMSRCAWPGFYAGARERGSL